MTWSRIWQLEKGEEVHGVAAHGEMGERLAVNVDPPFVAPSDGWYLCTLVGEEAIFAPHADPESSEHQVLPFAGREANSHVEPVEPFEWPAEGEQHPDPSVQKWIDTYGVPEIVE